MLPQRLRRIGAAEPAIDWLLVAALVALRVGILFRLCLPIPFHTSAILETANYATLAADLAAGRYWTPVVHSYGVPFFIFQPAGYLIHWLGRPVVTWAAFFHVLETFIVPVTYLWGRRMFGRRAGLIAAALMTFSLMNVRTAVEGVHVSVFATCAFLLIHSRLGRRAFLMFTAAGVLIGLPYGGTRLSPLLLFAACVCVLLWTPRWTAKAANLAGLSLGMGMSLIPTLTYFVQHGEMLGDLLRLFSSGGLHHVAIDRAFYAAIPAKFAEFLLPLLFYNPLATVPFLLAMGSAIRARVRGERLDEGERLLLTVVGALAFLLVFVFTNREPLGPLPFATRPPRYFVLFSSFVELLAGAYLARRLPMAALRAFFQQRAGMALVGALLALAVVSGVFMRNPRVDGPLVEERTIGEGTVVLANSAIWEWYARYRDSSFPFDYGDYLDQFPPGRQGDAVFRWLPLLFYSVQATGGPIFLRYDIGGRRADVIQWFLGMPVFSIGRLRAAGVPVGPETDVLLYLRRREFLRTVAKMQEPTFKIQFDREADDWELFRRFNPDVDLGAAVWREDADTRVVRLRLAPRAHDQLRLRFDHRDVLDPDAEFTVSPGSVYLDLLGFGWKTSANLVTSKDWRNVGLDAPVTEGVLVRGLLRNEFTIRTIPDTYEVRLVWRPADDRTTLDLEFPGNRLLDAQDIPLPDGRRIYLARAEISDRLILKFPLQSIIIYALEMSRRLWVSPRANGRPYRALP